MQFILITLNLSSVNNVQNAESKMKQRGPEKAIFKEINQPQLSQGIIIQIMR